MDTLRSYIAFIVEKLALSVGIIAKAFERFWYDDGFSRASALAYTTLFALVPITALSIIMYSSFGIDEQQVKNTVDKVMEQVLPPATGVDFEYSKKSSDHAEDDTVSEGKTVAKFANINIKEVHNEQLIKFRDHISGTILYLAAHARSLGILTIAVLFFIGISLLNTIESALNTVWRTTSNLTILAKILSFWAVITLGPLLIAVSIYWTTKAHNFNLIALEGVEQYGILYRFFVPVFVTTIALTILFYKLPAATVRLRDALYGAVISAVLFEFVKIGFSYYLTKTSGYSALYGVIATIPLFLFWLYLSWVVIIYGAEVAYLSGSINIIHGLRRYSTYLGEIGVVIGLRILTVIGKRFKLGLQAPTESEISVEIGADPVVLQACLNSLSEAGILSSYDPNSKSRTLLKPVDKIKVRDIAEAFRAKKYRGLEKALDQPLGETSLIADDVYVLDTIRIRTGSVKENRSVIDWSLDDILSVDS